MPVWNDAEAEMSVHYELNCGQFVLHRDGVPVLRPLDVVAIAFEEDPDSGRIILHKHGSVETVRDWVAKTKGKLTQSGGFGVQMANALELVEIKGAMRPDEYPPVDLLNEAIGGKQRALKCLVRPDDVIEVQAREVPN